MPCDEPVTRALLPVSSNSSNAIWRPHTRPERANSPPERLLDTVQSEAQERVGMNVEELHAFSKPMRQLVGRHRRAGDLAGGADPQYRPSAPSGRRTLHSNSGPAANADANPAARSRHVPEAESRDFIRLSSLPLERAFAAWSELERRTSCRYAASRNQVDGRKRPADHRYTFVAASSRSPKDSGNIR